jgi:FkbM family methyltransferase
VVAALAIYRIAGPVLNRFPIQRRIKSSGLVYRITSLDQLGIADELFAQRTYLAALSLGPINSLIDVGCNAGWFALWLAAEQPNPKRQGLLVDANERMAAEAEWHITRNDLEQHSVVFGAAGLPPDVPVAVFHILPSASQSSLLEHQADKQLPVKGRITDVTVPAVSIGREWRTHFGEAPVDLLKIDIEGNELDFVRYEGAFIRDKVRAVLLEWHKWHVTLADLDAALGGLGFARRGTYAENEMTGIALYQAGS